MLPPVVPPTPVRTTAVSHNWSVATAVGWNRFRHRKLGIKDLQSRGKVVHECDMITASLSNHRQANPHTSTGLDAPASVGVLLNVIRVIDRLVFAKYSKPVISRFEF